MAASPLEGVSGPVDVAIKADGNAIDDVLEILSVSVRAEVGRVPECVIVFADGSPAEQEFPLTDAATFKPGATVEVGAHFGADASQTIFEGVAVAQRLRLTPRGSRLEVTCRGEAVKLMQVRRTAVFKDQKDSAVISSIAGDAGLSATVDTVTTAARDQVQNDCTDWDFIRLLADRNGLMLTTEGATLEAKAFDASAAPVLTLTFGTDIEDFDAEVAAPPALSAATGRAWDASAQETVDATGTAPPAGKWGDLARTALATPMGDHTFALATPAPLADSDLAAHAGARLIRSEQAIITGRVRFCGSAKVRPGVTLELAGLGARFGGTGLVTGVMHRIEAGAWTTQATLGLPPEWRSDGVALQAPAAAALATPLPGLHVGKVLKIHDDPDANARIQVSLPALAADGVELWARFAAPYAGAETGMMFLPEIDDEVVVGFLAEDPAYPVVLGALHSAANARPVDADEGNTQKVIQTASKLKMTFDDDKKILTLETPGGASVTLDDEGGTLALADQNGNSIEMSSSGIKIDTPGDLALSATGNVEVAATMDATITGMNVSAEADVGFTGKGNATAEVSASGTMTVKGAMVMIN